jgi:hypothetical protein
MSVQVGDPDWKVFSWQSNEMYWLPESQQVHGEKQLPNWHQDLLSEDSRRLEDVHLFGSSSAQPQLHH